MKRRAAALLATAGLAAGLLAGCGIPDETPVQVDGPGPAPGVGQVDPSTAPQPPDRDDATEAVPFVKNFLRVPAGDVGTMRDRLIQYLPEGERADYKPAEDVTVVRLVGEPTFSGDLATITVQHVGLLGTNGQLAPPKAVENTYTMRVGYQDDSDGLWVLEPPTTTLMTVDALREYYEQRTIYFWSIDGATLVPDLRYLPKEVGRPLRPTRLLDWLAAGPATVLEPVAQKLPADSQRLGTAPLDNQQLTVTWSAVADEEQKRNLVTQIIWSLGRTEFSRLNFRVGGDTTTYDVNAGADGPKPAYPISDTPQRYAIEDGVVHRLSGPPSADLPPLAAEINRDIAMAAFTTGGAQTRAAVVVASEGGPVLRVGQAPGTVTALRTVGGVPRSPTSRPVWLPRPEGLGLIAANGRLYQFDAAGGSSLVHDIPGGVSAVAVAPDGNRIALVAGGRLYVIPITVSSKVVRVHDVRLITTSLTGLTAVAFSGENRLVVAGQQSKGRPAMVDISVDGGVELYRVNDTIQSVTMIAAFPENPVSDARNQPVMFEANGTAYRAVVSPEEIGRSEIADAPAPSPGAEAGKLSSPFYVY
jgi:hypothetical protein